MIAREFDVFEISPTFYKRIQSQSVSAIWTDSKFKGRAKRKKIQKEKRRRKMALAHDMKIEKVSRFWNESGKREQSGIKKAIRESTIVELKSASKSKRRGKEETDTEIERERKFWFEEERKRDTRVLNTAVYTYHKWIQGWQLYREQ